MASFHIIENETVSNIILADTKEIAEQVTGLQAIASDDESVIGASIGFVWDEATGKFVNPNPEPKEPTE